MLDVRDTFTRRPPPQMHSLLLTLQAALVFIKTFDERGWFMRVLKSGADKQVSTLAARRLPGEQFMMHEQGERGRGLHVEGFGEEEEERQRCSTAR